MTAPREKLFDLAVNRAASYLERFGLMERSRASARRARLALWYTRTRFVYRIPVDDVLACLESYPGPGHFWQGGSRGAWLRGDNPRP